MASLDDILNITEDASQRPEILIEKDGAIKKNEKHLFTIDQTKPIAGRVAYDEIYYLDRANTYTPTKLLGKYILKNHQLTTLYYMLELEKMLFDVKRIVKDPTNANPDVSLELLSTHYTNVGVLSDKVGAGKSYCVMALLNEAHSFHIKQLPFRNMTWGCNEIKTSEINKLDTNILLVPHGLVGQWKKYLEGSGLKYYTIQKAKDIFGLADDTCGFKGKEFSMIAKEDDEIIRPDDDNDDNDANDNANDNEDFEEEEVDHQRPIPTPKPPTPTTKGKSKITAKTKSLVVTAEAADTAEAAKPAITKKKANSKSSTAGAADSKKDGAAAAAGAAPSPTNKELEKEKKKLNTVLNELENQLDKKNTEMYKHHWGSPEHKLIDNERQAIKIEFKKVEGQIYLINQQIKFNDLAVGAIKITDIQQLHNAFEHGTVNFLPESLQSFIDAFGHLNKRAAEKQNVILVSATFWNLFALYLNRDKYTVNRILIDECNTIKGNRMVEVRRGFTWLITSSIQSMMTSTGYIWKQVRHAHGYNYNSKERTINSTGFIMAMIKELYERKHDNYKIYLINHPDYVEESMTLPELKTILVISKDNANIQVLAGVVSHDVLQMLNAGDIEGVITKLDVAVGDESNVIEMVSRKYQDDLKVKEYELRVAIENCRTC
jgi:hypothetical protein